MSTDGGVVSADVPRSLLSARLRGLVSVAVCWAMGSSWGVFLAVFDVPWSILLLFVAEGMQLSGGSICLLAGAKALQQGVLCSWNTFLWAG